MNNNLRDDDEQINLYIREYIPKSDYNFVINSWLNSSYRLFPNNLISKINYNKHITQVLDQLISHPNVIIKIASNQEDPDHIYGYLVYEHIETEYIIHWIYTKEKLRNFGIASTLLELCIPVFGDQPVFTTCVPQKSRTSTKELLKELNLIYEPFILSRRIK